MKICYFTLTTTTPTRDIVILNGLRNLGVEIIECRDFSPGLKKFWRLWQKHRALHGQYDILLVGFSGHILVPFARLISRKKIVFNTLGALYNGVIDSRKKYGFLRLRALYCLLIDWLAFHSADLTFVESDARKKYIMRRFFVPERKLVKIWPGADDTVFIYIPNIKKLPVFTVLFRGALMPESGIEYMLQAAHILRDEPINFRIMGAGYLAQLVSKMIRELNLRNVEWITERLQWREMTAKIQECHISLSQLSAHKRQGFHVPFKTAESMALKVPFLVPRNSFGVLEFLIEDETCFCVKPADAQDLAQKIMQLRGRPDDLARIAENAFRFFKKNFTTEAVAQELKNIFKTYLGQLI